MFSVVSPRFCVVWCGNPLIAGFCRLGFLRVLGRVSGVQSCFGCGFLVPHRSAKSGCFGGYLNVFVEFSSGFVVFYEIFWNLSRIEF